MSEPSAGPEFEEEPAEGGTRRPSTVALALGPALFALAFVVPLGTLTLADAAGGDRAVAPTASVRTVLGLALWMAAWWMTEVVPLAVTSLLPLAVLPIAGVSTAKAVTPTYFDETIALFLGGFCLALGMEKTGLHIRFAHGVVRRAGTSPRGLVFGFFAAAGLVSMWVSNTATALMLMPVAVTVARSVIPAGPEAPSAAHRRFAACVVLAVAYGASLGGVGTLVGTPPNMIFRAFVGEHATGMPTVSFGRWFLLGAPLVLVLIPLAWWLLVRVALPIPKDLALAGRAEVIERLRPKTRASFDELAVLGTFLTTAVLWITRERIEIGSWQVPLTGWGQLLGMTKGPGRAEPFVKDSTVAIVGAIVLFMLPSRTRRGERVLPWSYAARRLPWGALILFGGGLALADAFKPSGLNDYLAAAFQGLHGLPSWTVLLVVAFGLTAISEVASNTAAITMMLPVLFALGQGLGTDAFPILLAGTLAASCGFMLPVATPANTIAYGTGEVSAREMGRAGVLLDVAATLVMVAAVLLLGPIAFPR